MLDSSTKHPENRIHLFDPVGLINEGYRSSNYTARPRKPAKSYSSFEEAITNGGLRSYDGFANDASHSNDVGALRGYDSFANPENNSKNGELRSYESFSMEKNSGGIRSYEDINVVDDRNSLGSIRFGVDNNVVVDDDEGDVCTPRLWDNHKNHTSPKDSFFEVNSSVKAMNSSHTNVTNPLHSTTTARTTTMKSKLGGSSPLHQYHQNMSPNSRTEAIAKGRRELMEMVKDLPESFYELSLKDIVEQRVEMEVHKEVDLPQEKKIINESNFNDAKDNKEIKKGKKSGKKVKKSESKKKMVRSKSVDNGKFLLRTSVFPIFCGGRRNKKNLGPSNSFKIAPMPKPLPNSNGSFKAGEKDWWRRKSCILSGSDDTNGLSTKCSSTGTSSSSSRSSSSSGRRSNRFLPSCCLFNGRRFRSNKKQLAH